MRRKTEEAPVPIQVGDKFPSVTIKQASPEGAVDINPAEVFAGKKVVMFSLPGAFTPTCSGKHLPGYVAKYEELKATGVDLIACLSVNDHHVMLAWAKEHDAVGKILMLADGNATLSKALGIDLDMSAGNLGTRARRGAYIIEDGKFTAVEIEQPGKFEVSSVEACLMKMK